MTERYVLEFIHKFRKRIVIVFMGVCTVFSIFAALNGNPVFPTPIPIRIALSCIIGLLAGPLVYAIVVGSVVTLYENKRELN
jgi:hypothetical protein